MRNYLNDCLKIERVMGEFYRKLARVERYSEEVRSAFARMAQDEEDHARQLEIARGVPEEVFFAEPRIEEQQLDHLLRRAHRLLRLADTPPQSEREMLETARELELEFMQIHLRNAVRFHKPQVAELFRSLARDDEQHIATLDVCRKSAPPPSGPTRH